MRQLERSKLLQFKSLGNPWVSNFDPGYACWDQVLLSMMLLGVRGMP